MMKLADGAYRSRKNEMQTTQTRRKIVTLSEYIEFWKLSWDYMSGSRREFWFGLPRATMRYRAMIIADKKEIR